MFSQVLIKGIQVGGKLFHILVPMLESLDEYEKLGLEIIKDAQLMKQKLQEPQTAPEAVKAVEPPDEQLEVNPDGDQYEPTSCTSS